MTRPLSARLRRLWLDVHLWLGVGLLLVLAPLGLSGAVLVWHDPLDRALHAERYAVTGTGRMPIESYAAAADQAFAGRAALTQIRLPQRPEDPVVALGRLAGPAGPGGRPRTLNAWIDPRSGRVLGVAEVANGATMVLHRFHGSLLLPGVGRKIVGWLGWAMFVSCATGLWLWWPRHGAWRLGLRWRRGSSQLFNLHHMLGFWICLPLAVLSLTGVYIAFPQTSERLLAGRSAPPPAMGGAGRRTPPPLERPRLTPQAAAGAAMTTQPNARLASISWPQAGARPTWRVELAGAGARPAAVQVDDATGQAQPARASGAATRSALAVWMRRIHDGSDLGPLWQVVIALAGTAPTVLGLSGGVMWLRRRARRRAIAA